MPPRLTTEQFIERAHKAHGDGKFDYSKAEYQTQFIPVTLTCLVCDTEFNQKPHTHMSGYGCPHCAKANLSLTHDDFIARALAIHGGKYDYTDAVYTSMRDPVRLRCTRCDTTFSQTAQNHLRGAGGCTTCGTTSLSTEEFVSRAKKVHGTDYDYSKVKYRLSRTPVAITCLTCDTEFSQSPNDHLNGCGCRKCALSRRSSKMELAWLDSLGVRIRQYRIKIGKRGFIVDGYDPATNTIYEFLGDFWHGNPESYSPEGINPVTKKSFGDLYKETERRLSELRAAGYQVSSVWESDWLKTPA
jgi:Zn finger protein HypA/HybF involved in hydrogenase expression